MTLALDIEEDSLLKKMLEIAKKYHIPSKVYENDEFIYRDHSERKQEIVDGLTEAAKEVSLHLKGKITMQNAREAILEIEEELKSEGYL